jgi:hypothetical protein
VSEDRVEHDRDFHGSRIDLHIWQPL